MSLVEAFLVGDVNETMVASPLGFWFSLVGDLRFLGDYLTGELAIVSMRRPALICTAAKFSANMSRTWLSSALAGFLDFYCSSKCSNESIAFCKSTRMTLRCFVGEVLTGSTVAGTALELTGIPEDISVSLSAKLSSFVFCSAVYNI